MKALLMAAGVIVALTAPSLAVINVYLSADKSTIRVDEITTIHIRAQGTEAGLWKLAGDIQGSPSTVELPLPPSFLWQPYFNTPTVPPTPVRGYRVLGSWVQFASSQTQAPASAEFARIASVEIASYRILGDAEGIVQLQFVPGVVQGFQTQETNGATTIGDNAPLVLTVLAPASPPVAHAVYAEAFSDEPTTITMQATDDGCPAGSGLSYIITSLPACGTLRDPKAGAIGVVPYTLAGGGNQVIYTSTAPYGANDSFTYKANDGGSPPSGGDSNVATVSVHVLAVGYLANMDTDPGWTLDAGWTWGAPAADGSCTSGPASGYTGTKVIRNPGSGDNGNNPVAAYATMPPIDCRGLTNVSLVFYRWMNVGEPLSATIEASSDGVTWTHVWTNAAVVDDNAWQSQQCDISGVADQQSSVYIRFGLWPASANGTCHQWCIDHVRVAGDPVPNTAPTANAGDDQTITPPASAILAGSASDDGLPNPPAMLTHTWRRASGPGAVTFGDANALHTKATFRTDGTYVLQLVASDGVLTTTDTVTIAVNPQPNAAPTVDAVADPDVYEGQPVQLRATASDSDGDPLIYAWSQTGGRKVTLDDDSAPQATFTAPTVSTAGEASLTFRVAASDGRGGTATSVASVRIWIPGDASHDDAADVTDLLRMADHWGSTRQEAGFAPTCDFNGDGEVNIVDLLILAGHWRRKLEHPVFTREGTAYMDGVAAAAGSARTCTVAVCSPSDGIENMAANVGGAILSPYPECVRQGQLILNCSNGHVYRSTDGITVTQMTSTPPYLDGIWTLASGTLIGWSPHVGPKRSTDGGATWSTCTLNGRWTADDYPLRQGGFLEVDGVQFLAEYRAWNVPLIGRYVWKSIDDGATWTPCLDGAVAERDPSRQWYHIHSLGYHAATGRILAGCGDGNDRRQIWCTMDLGVTWSRLEVNRNDIPAQPMSYVDYGDPRRVAFGDDSNRGVGWLDVTTGELGNLLPSIDARSCKSFMFGLSQIGGVYYACGNDFSSDKRPAIQVSKDLAHWVTYHVIPGSRGFLTHAGLVGGRLHFTYLDAALVPQWLSISPAAVETRTAVLLEPGTTNLLDAEAGFFDHSTGGWNVVGTGSSMAWDTTANLAGGAASGCLKATYSGPAPLDVELSIASPRVSVPAGLMYGGVVWARCDSSSAAISIALRTTSGASSPTSSYYVDTTWRPFLTQPMIAADGTIGLQLGFIPTDRCRSIQIDAGQIALLPITQAQYGAAARAPDQWSYSIAAGPAWANTFTLAPSVQTYQLGAGTRYYVRSWVKDVNNHLQLCYDTTDSQFHLLATIGGVAAPPLSSAAMEWNALPCLQISVHAGADGLTMLISNGTAPAASSSPVDCSGLGATTLNVRAGDAAGANLLPHYLVPDLDSWK